MKNKILVVFLLLVTGLVICCESVQANGPQDLQFDPVELIGTDSEIMTPLAQNDIQPPVIQSTPNNYVPANFVPSQMVDAGLLDKYGLVGFMVLTSMGLVVYIVKQDRKTMSDLTEALSGNSKATMALAEATRQLNKQVESDIKQIHDNFNRRFDSVEKTIERIADKEDG